MTALLRWIACCLFPCACFPVMAHPTRVESGARFGTVVGLSIMGDSTLGESSWRAVMLPTFDLDLAVGIRDTSSDDGPGMRISAMGGMSGIGTGLYVEAGRRLFGDLDAGAGLSAHWGASRTVMPYVQIGRRLDNRAAWFLRNALSFTSDTGQVSGLWIPTIGWSAAGRGHELTAYVSAVLGPQRPVDRLCFLCQAASRTYVLLGASASMPVRFPAYGPAWRRRG